MKTEQKNNVTIPAQDSWIPVETSREGEWCIKSKSVHESGFADHIADYLTQENAEIICNAVNERQRLLDSNRELLQTAKSVLASWNHSTVKTEAMYQLTEAVNNAKKLH